MVRYIRAFFLVLVEDAHIRKVCFEGGLKAPKFVPNAASTGSAL